MLNIKKEQVTKAERWKAAGVAACLLFCLVTFILFAVKRDFPKAGMAVVSVVYVLIPFTVERLFRFRIQAPLYFVILVYTICPLLGFSYKFYYLIAWWDDLLHAFAGLIFAMFGAYLPRVLNKKGEVSIAVCALFALVFSIAVASVWEFAEFGMDSLFGTDMQKDTLLADGRSSYLLGKLLNLPVDQMANVSGTIAADGTIIKGYVDIGLLDTMVDMMVETAGALVYVLIYAVGKGKVFVFVPWQKSTCLKDGKPCDSVEEAENAAQGLDLVFDNE